MTEQEIIAGCIQEKKQCQEELFRRYAGKMLGICMRYARYQMEAEDMLQEAFIRVFDYIHQFKGKGSLEGWIKRIVINTAIKKTQKKSFQNEALGIEPHQDVPISPNVYDHLQAEEILALIKELPDGYRTIFNLYAIEGYSHKEIADLLGIQESTSRSQLVKARKLLQSILTKKQKMTA